MTYLKFKGAVAVLAIGIAAFSTPAFAQITTDDVDSQRYLELLRDESKEFRKDETKKHYKNQVDHYDRELKRLNALIKSYGYYKFESEDGDLEEADPADPAASNEEDKKLFDILNTSTAGRTAVNEATKGKSEEFGLLIDGFNNGSSNNSIAGAAAGAASAATGVDDAPQKFRDAIGLQKPNELYPDVDGEESKYAKNLHRLYSSLYVANTVAGEANKSRDDRYEVYDELLEKAKKSKDLRTELRIQNAILLENGRNLALLIDLQTAQLNSQTAQMSSAAIAAQKSEEMFGKSNGTPLGGLAFAALIEGIN